MAEQLALSGRVNEATLLLSRAVQQGDPDAMFAMGLWRLSGEFLPRKLVLSREMFRRAYEAGHTEAAAVYNAFLANGTGGAKNWPAALSLLDARAATDEAARRQLALIGEMSLSREGEPVRPPSSTLLSRSPEVGLFPGFLSASECDYLIDVAAPLLQPSVVIHPQTGQFVRDPVRNSQAAAFPLMAETPAIHAINRRIAAASHTDIAQGEPLQVLQYLPGQEYKAHMDAIPAADNQRAFTFLVYLNADFEGGETRFLRGDLNVRGQRGDGILFRNIDEQGRPNPQTLHAGAPVTRGVKFLASRWIRARPIDLTRR